MKPLTPHCMIYSYCFDKRRKMAVFLDEYKDFQSISLGSSASTVGIICSNTLLSYTEESLKLRALYKPNRVIHVPKTRNYIIMCDNGPALFVDLERELSKIIPYVFTLMMDEFRCFEGNILAWIEDEDRSIKFFDYEQGKLLCSFDGGYSIVKFHYNHKEKALITLREEVIWTM